MEPIEIGQDEHGQFMAEHRKTGRERKRRRDDRIGHRQREFLVEWTDCESDPLEDENGLKARIVDGKVVDFTTSRVVWEQSATKGWGLPLADAR